MSLWSASAAVAVALAVAAYLLRRSRFFVTAVLIAAVAAGFATATPSGRRISLMLC
jgi:competence protein ComEC